MEETPLIWKKYSVKYPIYLFTCHNIVYVTCFCWFLFNISSQLLYSSWDDRKGRILAVPCCLYSYRYLYRFLYSKLCSVRQNNLYLTTSLGESVLQLLLGPYNMVHIYGCLKMLQRPNQDFPTIISVLQKAGRVCMNCPSAYSAAGLISIRPSWHF